MTLDAGAQFTMAGVICDVPPAGVVTIRLRTSADGAPGAAGTRLPLEVADESASARRSPIPVDRGRRDTCRSSAARRWPRPGHARPASALVAIDPNVKEASPPASPATSASVAATVAGVGFTQAAVRGVLRARHRDPRRVGRRREPPHRSPSYRAGQDGLHPPHRQRQHYTPADAPGHRPRHLRVPHQEPRLERHRLQLPRRPVRHHLRRPVRRRHAGRDRRAGRGLQHRSTGISVLGTFIDRRRRPLPSPHSSGFSPGSSPSTA